MTAYCILCNDHIEGVSLDGLHHAERVMEAEKQEDFQDLQRQHNYTLSNYESFFRWHIEEVRVI